MEIMTTIIILLLIAIASWYVSRIERKLIIRENEIYEREILHQEQIDKDRKDFESISQKNKLVGEKLSEATDILEIERKKLKDFESKLKEEIEKHHTDLEEFKVLVYKAEDDENIADTYKEMYSIGIDTEDKMSDELKTELMLSRQEEGLLIKEFQDGKNPAFKRLSKIIVGAFNTEVNYIIKDMTYSKRNAVKTKIINLYNTYNKKLKGTIMYAASETQYWNQVEKKRGTDTSQQYFNDYTLPSELLEIKLQQVDINSSYLLQKEVEKEKRQEEIKIMREQMEEERLLKLELDKLAKEETHYNNQIKKYEGYMTKTKDDSLLKGYLDKISELEQQLREVRDNKHDVESKTFNNKAGYVYVISNEGSLGKDIIKIGVTRRLEPMERVRELSSASVPFDYSVHAFIFSQDAFELESNMHKHFRKYQVNKVNNKKEFFKVPIEEVEDYVHSKIDPMIAFDKDINSEQYLETMRILAETGEEVVI